MLLDFDPEIVAFSGQPFLLIWPGHQRGECTHTPDFFARRADGTGVVIDVRPDDLIDPKAAKVFDLTASACSRAPAFSRFVPIVQSPHMTHEREATLVGQVK